MTSAKIAGVLSFFVLGRFRSAWIFAFIKSRLNSGQTNHTISGKEGYYLRKYITIGFGAFAGAMLRYLIEQIRLQGYHENVPLNTFFINITGAFLLAFIMTIALEVWKMDADIRMGITTGFIGAYTTFSTLCKETVALLRNGDYFSAISYMTVSAMLGFAAAYFGVVLARKIGSRITKEEEMTETGFEAGTEEFIEDESEVSK